MDWLRASRGFAVAFDLVVGAVFWVWAIYNTATKGGFDAGCVSFAFAVLSGILGCARHKWYPSFMYCAHALVTINYIGGAIVKNTTSEMGVTGFRIYCALFAVLWAATGVWFRAVHRKLLGYDTDL